LARHNYRDVMHRFTHIDGEIRHADVRLCCAEAEASVRIVVSVYPWWEHPQYIAARASGAAWGFKCGNEAARDLVIEAVRPHRCELTGHRSATDLVFLEEHPSLWEFEDEAEIFCNSDVDRAALFDAVLKRQLPGVTRAVLEGYLGSRTAHRAPYSMGCLPYTLFHVVKEELELMEARTHISRKPSWRQVPIVLALDDSAVVIADDFFLEIPDFEHRPEWFVPAASGEAG
jgi:hypothetical protein